MTRVPTSSSRSLSESTSPLDLTSGLASRLQATSFQPSTPDCAVLPNSTVLGAGVPPPLLSVAEEGLVLPAERVSSEVGSGYDKGRLTQPGKSYYEEKSFLRLRDNEDEDRGLVSGSGLLTELTQSVDAP